MKANWKTIGITAVAAGLLYYPSLMLFRYLTRKEEPAGDSADGEHPHKALLHAYRGKHKYQNRAAHTDRQ